MPIFAQLFFLFLERYGLSSGSNAMYPFGQPNKWMILVTMAYICVAYRMVVANTSLWEAFV